MNNPNRIPRTRRSGFICKLFITSLVGLALLPGCNRTQSEEGGRRFELKGKVVSVDKAHQQLEINHEAVPGLMEGMTMTFTLKEREPFDVVSAGDRIQATLVVTDKHTWLQDPIITKGGGDDATRADDSTQPQRGVEVPDFTLVNQDGRAVHLQQYRGRALLLTFVYTRCPLPDYCTLMSTNFAQVERELAKDPKLSQAAHLLSVSIDPVHDTPKVLKSYGAAHTEKYADEKFDRWEFATGQPEEIKRMATFFGLTYFDENNQIVHSLRTAIVAPDGRVYKIYRGNEWKPEDVLRDLQTLINGS
jgi:protein SCO1/2